MELLSGNDSPMENLCLVINGWESDDVSVQLDNKVLKKNKDYRIGKRRGLEKEDLILWIEHAAIRTTVVDIKSRTVEEIN